MVVLGFLLRSIHHRGAEFAEIGEFFNQELFTSCPESGLSCVEGRLRSSAGSLRPERVEGRGAISESCFTGKPEDPRLYGSEGQEASPPDRGQPEAAFSRPSKIIRLFWLTRSAYLTGGR